MGIRIERVQTMMGDGAGGVARTVRFVGRQPGWVSRTALTTILLVIAVPVFLLLLLAAAAGIVVFLALSAVLWVGGVLRGLTGGSTGSGGGGLLRGDGRSNVRVVRREDG